MRQYKDFQIPEGEEEEYALRMPSGKSLDLGSDHRFSGGEGEKWEEGEDGREDSREQAERRGMGRVSGESESNRTTISRPLARFKG